MILVNISEIPWSEERRRNTAIFLELLDLGYEEGVYVGPAEFDARGVLGRAKALRDSLRVPRVAPRVYANNPTYALPIKHQAKLIARAIRRRVRGRPFCLWINCVDLGSFAIAEALRPHAAKVVVDLSDDWTTFASKDPAGRDARLRQALAWADAVLAVNEVVVEKFPHRNLRLVRNATDFANFQRHDRAYKLGDVLPKQPGQKIIGFHGGLNVGRVDEQLLDELVDGFPDATFLFVGYSNSQALCDRLTSRPNVRIYPAVPFTELPHVIKSFDVAIVPHELNDHTRGNDLLKVIDYLACGVPIVSTDVSNVRRHGAAIQVASSRPEFLRMVRAVLDGAPHDPAPGLAAAEATSWHRTVPDLAKWLDGVFAGR